MKKFLFNTVLPPILGTLIVLWCKTLRIENLDPETDRDLRTVSGPHILTSWHSRIFLIFYYYRGLSDLSLLVSPSTDGDLLAGLCRWMGYRVVRGSSYKKTVSASRTVVKTLKDGFKAGIVADGSRGPRHIAQIGTLHLARIAKATYSGVSWEARWKYEFNSWDRLLLPLPFSRCRIRCSPILSLPLDPPPAAHDLETKREELEEILNHLTGQCTFS